MEDFERKLRTIPLTRPSNDLRRRIFGGGLRRSWVSGFWTRRIPLGWAAAFAVATGVAGMVVSELWINKAVKPVENIIRVEIVEAASRRNTFDFTRPASDFMPGDLTVRVENPEEI